MTLLRLESGRLLRPGLKDLSEGRIGQRLRRGADSLNQDVCAKLKIAQYGPDPDYRRLYYQALHNIVNIARDNPHGATFVVIPQKEASARALNDLLRIKYPLEAEGLWEDLIWSAEAHWHRARAQGPHRTAPRSAKRLVELMLWKEREVAAEHRLYERAAFISDLSGVDGAVVLSRRLQVIGFGAEIVAPSPALAAVKVAQDPLATRWSPRSIDSYGTRHRSAFRLSSALKGAVCFVLSQDGGVRAVTGVGADVVVWDDVSSGTSLL